MASKRKNRMDNNDVTSVKIPDKDDVTDAQCDELSSNTPIYAYAIPIATGYIFGFVMEKGRVFEPVVIRDMMVLRNFTMLKMFLTALSTSMLSMFIASKVSKKSFEFCSNDFYNSLRSKSVTSSILGGLIIGVGMPICGSCPTSVFTQLGALVSNSHYTLLGGLVATYAYTVVKPYLDTAMSPSSDESSNPWVSKPYPTSGLLIAGMFGGIAVALETLLPWQDVVILSNSGKTIFAYNAWPPYVSGLVIGCLQLPLILGINQTLGGTSSLLTICSLPLIGPVRNLGSCYLQSFQSSFANWWQVIYVLGVAGGAYSSAYMSGQLGSAVGVSAPLAFGGGFLLMFGARIAGGCTSGHGITGMAMMSIMSVLTTATMFGGAMATGVIMKYAMGMY